jgi:hypothetical protein
VELSISFARLPLRHCQRLSLTLFTASLLPAPPAQGGFGLQAPKD